MQEELKELIMLQKTMINELKEINKRITNVEKQLSPQTTYSYKGNLYHTALINLDNNKKSINVLNDINKSISHVNHSISVLNNLIKIK